MPSSLGPAEILVILVIALIVLGPARLPEAGRQVGKALTEIRRWTQDVKSEMTGAFTPESPTASMPNAAPIFDPMPDPSAVPKLEDAPTAPIEDALIRPEPPPETPTEAAKPETPTEAAKPEMAGETTTPADAPPQGSAASDQPEAPVENR